MSEIQWMNIFADNLVAILNEYRLTQRDLADMSGLSESAISQYIHKQKIPSLKAIINMAYALDMSIDDFIDFGDRVY